MKEKILTGIIGLIVGMIIATLGWGVYIKNVGMNMNNFNNKDMFNNRFNGEMPNGNMERPQMPEGNRDNLTSPTRYTNSNI